MMKIKSSVQMMEGWTLQVNYKLSISFTIFIYDSEVEAQQAHANLQKFEGRIIVFMIFSLINPF